MSLRRAVLTLLAGGAAAQALPLLLGPWLTRLFTPEALGHYHLFAAVLGNLAVVACARYEWALPLLVGRPAHAQALHALCWRVLTGLVLVAAGVTACLGAWGLAQWPWMVALPVGMAVLGGLSIATLEATRQQRHAALAWARVLQFGAGPLLQGVGGVLLATAAGATGVAVWWPEQPQGRGGASTEASGEATLWVLVAGPVLAAAAAWACLAWRARLPRQARAPRHAWRAMARRFRDFPLLNTPHAFLGALQDTVAIALVAHFQGAAAAGAWGLALRYLKAPATLVGGAVSQALYPQLAQAGATVAGRRLVRRCMLALAALALPWVVALWGLAPSLFEWLFGPPWRVAGDLACALALYIGAHFVASPLGVVPLAWQAQAWALRWAAVGQVLFVLALGAGLLGGGLVVAGWTVSLTMLLFFSAYFWQLARWPVSDDAGLPSVPRAGGTPP